MNYTALTDQIFQALDNPVLERLEQLLPAYEQALKQAPESGDTHIQLQKNAEIRAVEVQKIADALLAVYKEKLQDVIPGAAFWYGNSPKPENENVWVLDPFSHALMGNMTMGVSLLQNNTLKISILWLLDLQLLYTGVEGEGAMLGDNKLQIRNSRFSTESNGMNYIIGNEKPNLFIHQLKDKHNFYYMVNKVEENISQSLCQVARGMDDFCSVSGKFSFPAIAAAVGVVTHAGAVVTDFSGKTDKLFSGVELFCGSKVMHEELFGN